MAKLSWRIIFLTVATGIALLEMSLLSFVYLQLVPWFFFLTLGSFFILTWWRLEYGLAALFGELFLGVHGYMLSWQGLSLRIALFLIFMVVALWRLFPERTHILEVIREHRRIMMGWSLFVLWIIVAGLNGLQNNPSSHVLFDINAYFFLGLFPIIFYLTKSDRWPGRLIWNVLLGSLLVLAGHALGTFWLFSRQGFYPSAIFVYRWLRGDRILEVTSLPAGFWRIFGQSYLYVLLAFFLLVRAWLEKRIFWRSAWLFFAAAGFVLLVALSRSYWVGLAAGGMVLIYEIWRARFSPRHFLGLLGVLVLASGTAWSLTWMIAHPVAGVATERVVKLEGEPAFDSRKNQLAPLWHSIKKHPLIGSGFGASLSYVSADPRHPGLYTTFAFEWGYLDMWLKFGLVGLALFGWWLWSLWRTVDKKSFGSLSVLAALLAIHMFSPYLNHPLGLGYLYLWAVWSYD